MRLSRKQIDVFVVSIAFIALLCSGAKPYSQTLSQKSPDLGQCVFIIKPQLHEDSVHLFNEIANIMDQDGTREMAMVANNFRGIAKGGHGSGFLVVDADGNNFVITNRHVVEGASSVNIMLRDGPSYNTAPILYIDRRADLAVIQFPGGHQPFSIGLPISTTSVSEETEIYAAGYPGLLDQPSWRNTRGIVTNQSVTIDNAFYIEHDAPIDPGNSGGALLIRKGTGFVVVGVNTLTYKSGQNRNFAVPSGEINRVIREAQKILHMTDDEKEHALEKACHELSDEMNSQAPDLNNLEEFISPRMVASRGFQCFNDWTRGKGHIQDKLFKGFIIAPLKTMRLSILVSMKNDLYSRSNGSLIAFDHIIRSDISKISYPQQSIRTSFRCGTSSRADVIWMFEYGKWRVVDLVGLKTGVTQSRDTSCQTIRDNELKMMFDKCKEAYISKEDQINCLGVFILEYCKKINGGDNACSKTCVNTIIEQAK